MPASNYPGMNAGEPVKLWKVIAAIVALLVMAIALYFVFFIDIGISLDEQPAWAGLITWLPVVVVIIILFFSGWYLLGKRPSRSVRERYAFKGKPASAKPAKPEKQKAEESSGKKRLKFPKMPSMPKVRMPAMRKPAVAEPAPEGPAAGKQSPKRARFCGTCGCPVEPGQRFCEQCGRKL